MGLGDKTVGELKKAAGVIELTELTKFIREIVLEGKWEKELKRFPPETPIAEVFKTLKSEDKIRR